MAEGSVNHPCLRQRNATFRLEVGDNKFVDLRLLCRVLDRILRLRRSLFITRIVALRVLTLRVFCGLRAVALRLIGCH
jgi:hypothetical protein